MRIRKPQFTRKNIAFLLAAVLAFAGLGIIANHNKSTLRATAQETIAQTLQSPATEPFPDIDESTLTNTQKNLVALLRDEYAKKSVSYDENMLVYSDGVKEPWCADFVSWAMREIGQPLSNPNSGSWRIPGVYTLSEYYQAKGRYIEANGYTPQPGDVALYMKTPRQSHTNIVLVVDEASHTMTTLGGNENGHMRLRTQSYNSGTNDLVGFGALLQ